MKMPQNDPAIRVEKMGGGRAPKATPKHMMMGKGTGRGNVAAHNGIRPSAKGK